MSILLILPPLAIAAAIIERPRRANIYRKRRTHFEATKTAR